jgi:hypothetical protein
MELLQPHTWLHSSCSICRVLDPCISHESFSPMSPCPGCLSSSCKALDSIEQK